MECAFCRSNLSRRNWHSGTNHTKVIWQCVTATKKGRKHCPHSKALFENVIEGAFLESYQRLCSNHTDVLDELMGNMEMVLSNQNHIRQLNKVKNEIKLLEQKRCKLIDLCLDEKIDRVTYEELEVQLNKLLAEQAQLERGSQQEIDLEKRLEHLRRVLQKHEVLSSFDLNVFESIVEKVIVGDFADPTHSQNHTG
ncbi:recombinase zinc beta ribbon domain-containing protein [Paenibacillus sp. 1P03SA]|uniref:recombinase zinc beta ribbon domain-containing protein n=1 Tax=Paenibacillus sp. 1P03SA TaxID=3132294 RepID=UPI0039A2269C